MKHRYDWKPDLPDQRDFMLVKAPRKRLAKSVDLRSRCTPIEDQGDLGSCTAHAITSALEFVDNLDGAYTERSRLMLYYLERALEGTISQDAGAQIRDGVKACAKTGVCDEKLWPYAIAKFKAKPPVACYTDAAKRKITSYLRAADLTAMRASLSDGFPVTFGFSVYESFESDAVAATGKVPMPKKSERLLGGHAVLAVGYNDATRRLLVRNSWGTGWGVKGYFTMPYAYLEDRNLSDDFWTVRA